MKIKAEYRIFYAEFNRVVPCIHGKIYAIDMMMSSELCESVREHIQFQKPLF